MRHGRLGTINWADRLAILTLDACHVQTQNTIGPTVPRPSGARVEYSRTRGACAEATDVVEYVTLQGVAGYAARLASQSQHLVPSQGRIAGIGRPKELFCYPAPAL